MFCVDETVPCTVKQKKLKKKFNLVFHSKGKKCDVFIVMNLGKGKITINIRHMCFILSIVLVESKMTANVFVPKKNFENLA